MAGSKGGKHSNGKGKSKSNTNQKKPESFDQSQISNKAHETLTTKGKNPKLQRKKKTGYTESELEEFLYIKLEDTYTKAKNWLLSRGYDREVVERAVLHGGNFHGPLDELMNNILTNSITYIEQENVEANGESCKDMQELYKTMQETLIDLVLHSEQMQLRRGDAMWLLLIRSWGYVPSTTTISHLRSGDQNTNSAPDSFSVAEKVTSILDIASSSKKVRVLERINSKPALVSELRQNIPILVANIREEFGDSVNKDDSGEMNSGSEILGSDFLTLMDNVCVNINRWLESRPNDPSTATIVELIIDLKNLLEKVNVRKEWALQKVIGSAKRLSKDLLELRILKMEKVEAQFWKDERFRAEQSCKQMVREAEFSMRRVDCEAKFVDEKISSLGIGNAKIRAETEGLKLSASEYEVSLNEHLNKERSYKKKVSNIEKQARKFRAQCDEEIQRVLQLQLEDSHVEKETMESESKWREEIMEKDHMHALMAEEARKATAQKASSKEQLAKLRQELNIEIQQKRDQHLRLEDELSRLHLSHQLSNLSLEVDNLLHDEDQVTSSSSRHWKCILCLNNDVSVVLLPCTHQVLCARCYEENCSSMDGRCPFCHTMIQQCIKIFGHSPRQYRIGLYF